MEGDVTQTGGIMLASSLAAMHQCQTIGLPDGDCSDHGSQGQLCHFTLQLCSNLAI